MRKLVYLDSATDDLIEILRYVTTESANLSVGTAFVSKLRARCAHLASLPGTLGSDRGECVPRLRSVSSYGYIIFFRYAEERLEVVNILHASRDVQAHFDND
ncbi:type II toxin-antitoxin system RelE/ParE family toxin [Blastomonas sp. AAP53]|uniref:type II toxin-antitoxin system RelE/ParE family toxin n=1 Tax=Blastomonas sp. AAP53 TaxID=1248760 RepID=UPI00035ED3FC|nr:type II toxin-antitoxin system RelE/ParE family toxin [Blastomonas sp. AAP53]